MKKLKKPSAGGKRRPSGNGPARPATARNMRRKVADHSSVRQEGKPAQAAPASSARSREEGKRKLWERKQAELEARWLDAQTRQNAENAARKRKMTTIGYGMTGVVVAAGVLAWWLI
jgi:hypothetical protein